MEVRMNTLTPELFLDLYQSVGWEPPYIEQVSPKLPRQIIHRDPNPGNKITGLRLFHNHMTIEPVLEIFNDFNVDVILKLRYLIFGESGSGILHRDPFPEA